MPTWCVMFPRKSAQKAAGLRLIVHETFSEGFHENGILARNREVELSYMFCHCV